MDEQKEVPVAVSKKVRAVRGRWTAVQRAQIVAESSVAGASVQSVAARHGIRAALLSSWRRKARAKSAKRADKSVARFAAVRVESAVAGTLEIDLAKGCVRVLGTVSSVMLREVLALVR